MTATSSGDYTLCSIDDCPFFVERNDDAEHDPSLASYLHLTRGDDADDALDNHDPIPGETRSLEWWKQNGPERVIERFTERRTR